MSEKKQPKDLLTTHEESGKEFTLKFTKTEDKEIVVMNVLAQIMDDKEDWWDLDLSAEYRIATWFNDRYNKRERRACNVEEHLSRGFISNI